MSEVWGTVFQMERDKANGWDADTLRREVGLLRACIRVNGLMHGNTHEEIDATLEQIRREASGIVTADDHKPTHETRKI